MSGEFVSKTHQHVRRGIEVIVDDQEQVVYGGLHSRIDASASPLAPIVTDNPGDRRRKNNGLFRCVVNDDNVGVVVFKCVNAFDDVGVSVASRNYDRQVHPGFLIGLEGVGL